MQQATSQFITINGLKLHLYVAGDDNAPPIVLLHGGGIDSAKTTWRHLIDPLAQTHRVYAPDLPGYGESEAPPKGTYTTAFLIDMVTALVDALELKTFALAGLSMGGATALGLALQQPERVNKLILVAAYGLQDEALLHGLSRVALSAPTLAQRAAWGVTRAFRPVMWAGLASIYFNALALDKEVLDDASESVSLEVFYEWLRDEITEDGCKTNYTPQLKNLHVPTLLVHGMFDRSVPVDWAIRANRRLPNSELAIIQFAGHWVTRERPRRFNRVVLRFLRDR